MRKPFLSAVCAALLIGSAAAQAQSFSPFVIRDIRVDGLQRTEAGTVFGYLPVKVGETLTEEKAQQTIRALFGTGFFKDVRLEVDNGVLVVLVEERPAIAQLDFVGIKEFQPEQIRKILRDTGLAEGRIFDRALLDSAEQEMKRQYLGRGLYAAEVQTTVTPLERNRVGIVITVTEGTAARIRTINIVGANAYREKDLLGLFVLRPPGLMTWYTKDDQYSRRKLTGDLEVLRSHYQNNGYLDFNIESTQVSISPDKKDIFITVNIVEGEKYTVSSVDLAGTFLVPKEDLAKLVQLKPGDVFSRDKLVDSTKAINDRLGNDGYAFANANAVPNVDKEKRQVSFTIMVDPGRRVYVRRINVAGNTKTRDEVIRREMRQLEGAYYDNSRIQQSRKRVDRTQYFEEVTVDTQPVADSPDQVDVTYTVKEKATGSFIVGAGFSSVERVSVQSSIQQTNIFGSGKSMSLGVNSGKVNRTYALSYTNPFFTVDGVSQGFDIYRRDTNATSLTVAPYATKSYGGGLRFGYPITETQTIGFGIAGEQVDLTVFANSPLAYINFVNQFGRRYTYGSGTLSWTNDSRDSGMLPTQGVLSRVSGELTGGDLQYYRVAAGHSWYIPVTRWTTLHLGADAGLVKSMGGKSVPFFKNFYSGGPGTVRGYRPFSLGPVDATGASLGGTRKLGGIAELRFPVPGAENDRSLALSTFLDAGQVYGANEKLTLSALRYAAGVAVSWNSPFGPLKLSFGQPLNAKPQDRKQRLQFTMGTAF